MINIGIFGFSTVGSGVVEILSKHSDKLTIKKICVRDINKKRTMDLGDRLTTKAGDIILDPEIDIVVEVMGTIEEAKKVIEEAFKHKKHVVSANKDLIALYGEELTQLARRNNCQFLYEASVAGAIPILRTIQTSLFSDNIKKIGGIVNGSTNYILTRMQKEKLSLERIIEDAKRLGFLEADPSADLDGLDAARKCAILSSISFNTLVKSTQVYTSGIRNISLEDIQYAEKLGYSIKLLAIASEGEDSIIARVHPALIKLSHPLAGVDYELNSVYVICENMGETMYYGRGAGSLPTGSAVVADIFNIIKNIGGNYEYGYNIYKEKPVLQIEEQEFSYYLRGDKKEIEILKEKLAIKDKLINEGVLITEKILEKDLLKIIGEEIKFIRIEDL